MLLVGKDSTGIYSMFSALTSGTGSEPIRAVVLI